MDLTLVMMAAGVGSRYGGLKQIEKVGPQGAALMKFAIFDALRSGFNRFIVIVSPNNEGILREQLGCLASLQEQQISIDFVQQRLEDLPEGFSVPPGRRKPWGTGQAVWAIRNIVQSPFVVINADDFYGLQAFKAMSEFFHSQRDNDCACALVCYELKNTLSPFGSVSRALCSVNENSQLVTIEEHKKIIAEGSHIFSYHEHEKQVLRGNQPVSVNFFGFSPKAFFLLMPQVFSEFLSSNITSETAEFYLPTMLRSLMDNQQAVVQVLPTKEHWLGMTYREDKPYVDQAILTLTQQNCYPQKLF